MPFPFTFQLSVPGLSNPFSYTGQSAQVQPRTSESSDFSDRRFRKQPGKDKTPHKRPPAIPNAPTPPVSRKRGWGPTFAEPSRSTTTIASTSGYLDTPAKYMAVNQQGAYQETDLMASDTEMPPPAKRRRGLAGSIVSTALSAALIGTAVGLTVYRLWRDRGKESERLVPPPPYEQEWIPSESPAPLQIAPPPTPRSTRKSRNTPASITKRPTHRRTRTRTHLQPSPPRTTPPALFPPSQPEFNFGHEDEEPSVVDDQMDWIGDKLSMLIEEGKKALNREVVVMSDAKEDEFDDGSGAWEEEDLNPAPSVSRSSSMRRTKRSRNIPPIPTFSGYSTSPSPKKSGFDLTAFISPSIAITPRRTQSRGISVEPSLNMTPNTSFREDETAWESPELRDSMEKARARLLRNRGT